MLVKHPGLTIVAVLTLAVGIPVGMAPMHLASAIEAPLPEDPDDRIRALRYWDPVATRAVLPTGADLALWQDRLASFDTIGAFRTSSYSVAAGENRAALVPGAEVSATTFDILATPPLMGRTLRAADSAAGAPSVVVIGDRCSISVPLQLQGSLRLPGEHLVGHALEGPPQPDECDRRFVQNTKVQVAEEAMAPPAAPLCSEHHDIQRMRRFDLEPVRASATRGMDRNSQRPGASTVSAWLPAICRTQEGAGQGVSYLGRI